MILTLDYGRFTPCQSESEHESQTFQHNSAIVPHKPIDII
jgi:hypothetical protein